METYLIIIGIILVVIALLFAAIKLNANFRAKAYKLFLYAENNLDEDKMDYCVEELYSKLPTPLDWIPQPIYRMLLQKAFDEIKDLLDDGRFNDSNKTEEEAE